MTFKKPKNITYTEMCIYIDNNVYNETFDESLVYEYLYHILYMLATQAHIFSKYHYYDYFALYGATRIFLRLTNKRQWEPNPDGSGYKLDRIKSVLNYAKKILYPLKVDFEQSEYCQSVSKDAYVDEVEYNFANIVNSSIDSLTFCEFGLTFDDIGKTCDAFLRTLPYKSNSSEWLNIYISVMLTFLNDITLTNTKKSRLQHLIGTNRLTEEHVVEAFKSESPKAILFHLPESMNDYIVVLTRQLKHLVVKDLCGILHTNVSNDMALVSLSVRDYVESYEEGYYED